MSEPFLGEIRLFANNFAPRGWAFCAGQILPISTHSALFSLLGTYYGGNGTTTFALPDLRGRVPISTSSSYPLGVAAGVASHTLTSTEIPAHVHVAQGSSTVPSPNVSPSNGVWGDATGQFTQSTAALAQMSQQAISTAGGSQAHPNMQPYLALNYCIALEGIYPSRN
ncbi:phage tail protein [Tumebacillus permanentifrigoris]|uniref:Microcystin-dependent protein n=1 Tax=Tumebacillus permanentifrigoris TaxID=378543 RepID=A0A316DBS3_9BACL|nr:tail fiber protein [Tumebacillus permanentifrigoris]PWK13484.1 microcystin-dependent protein [Tumebacillus permanentifrigoris]